MMSMDMAELFEQKKPFASSAVWACTVYSLVPFVGIVFIPFVFLFGIVAAMTGHGSQRRSAVKAMGAGVLVLIVQAVLWWLMYMVPDWSREGWY
jgi:hypothetical protein